MKTIVGVFDAPENVEQATRQLAAAELDAVVLDESILEQEPSLDPAVPTLVRGAAAEVVEGRAEPTLLSKRDRQTVMREFRERLAQDFKLPEEVSDAYTTTLAHGGRFVVVRGDEEDTNQAGRILERCGATQVNKHD